MSFQRAVESIPQLAHSYCRGLQALRSVDARHISVADPRKLAGSVDIDSSPVVFPGRRWDYAIGYNRSGQLCIFWVEVHPGNSGEVKAVIGKLQSLKAWLANAGQPLNTHPRQFIWVSSGETTFTPSAPQRKQFVRLGLEQCGGHLRIA